MNANRLAVLLAYYRGLETALDAESKRGNFEEDVKWLQQAGLIVVRHPGAGVHNSWAEVTTKGQERLRKALAP